MLKNKRHIKSFNEATENLNISDVSSSDVLILLERKFPTYETGKLFIVRRVYEIHKGKIEQSKNLILTTKDKEFAERLVNGYNDYC